MIAMPAMAGGPPSASTATGDHGATGKTLTESATLLEEFLQRGPPGGNGNGDGNGPPAGDGPPGHHRGTDAADLVIPDLPENTTHRTLVSTAQDLQNLTTDTSGAIEAINSSLAELRAPNQAGSQAAFEHLAEAQRSLGTLNASSDELEDASAKLYRASNATARRAVVESALVVDRLEFDNPGQRQAAESALGNALDALERAERTASRGKPNRTVARARATGHHATAWKHTERVLDIVERNVEPRLSVTSGQAFEENDTVQVPIRALLSDVRPYAYGEAEVTVEDADVTVTDEPDPIRFMSGAAPGSHASGVTLLSLAEAGTVTVTITAVADDRVASTTTDIEIDPERVIPDRPAPDEHREVTVSDDESGVRVQASGDGLFEDALEIRDETPDEDTAFRAGPMVRIGSKRDVDSATVTVPLADDVDPADGNLSIYTWDPGTAEPWTPVDTEVDADAGTATAQVDHFSYFSVFWVDEWDDVRSDATTLDERPTGDGGDAQLVDIVLVIDESGSMGGDPISFARVASERFVGGLMDDERVSLVGYSGQPDLYNRLTTDHDVVNASIANLSTADASGGTNTEGALNAALQELETNGLDNRSDVIILLSDGNSNRDSYPRRAAEDAADAGIEISTVGLGSGIDERELRDVADIAGGDFYHVQDPEDLPETFERVAQNRSDVALNDTNGDGIPDRVAEMDLRMPTGPPGVVGEPLNLDPILLDTSGDGIRDNETVDIAFSTTENADGTISIDASVLDAEHHPARVDTTGDGFLDRDQLEEREIEFTTSPEDSIEYLDAIKESDELDAGSEHLSSARVTSNPLANDTDGDGLPDAAERELGTHPRETDTTGDRIDDKVAFEENLGPTLYDFKPPDVDVGFWRWEKPSFSFRTEYELRFNAQDEAGLGGAEVLLGGDVQTEHSLTGQWDDAHSEFSTGFFGSVTDFYSGTTVSIQASDLNDNRASVMAINRYDIFGELAAELSKLGIGEHAIPHYLGTFSGLSTGAVDTVEFIHAFFSDPVGFVQGVAQIIGAIGNLDEIIAQLPAAVERQQELANPYDPDTESTQYDTFRMGWYRGYVTWLVIETVLPGGQAARALKSSNRLKQAAQALDRGGQAARAASYIGKAGRTATAPVRITGHQLSRALTISKGLAREGAENTLSRVRSATMQHQVAQRLRDVPAGFINRLTPDEQSRLGRFLARNGDAGKRALAPDGGPEFERLYRSDRLDASTLDRVTRAFDDDLVDSDDLRRIADGLEDGVIDQDAVNLGLTGAYRMRAAGHDVTALRVGREANHRDPLYTVRYNDDITRNDLVDGQVPDSYKSGDPHPGYSPPHKDGGLVVEGELGSSKTKLRAHNVDNQEGVFMVPKEEFTQVAKRDGISGLEREYALLNGAPEFVSEVTVPKGTRIRMSTVRRQGDLPGGGTQVEVRVFTDELNPDWFGTERPLEELID